MIGASHFHEPCTIVIFGATGDLARHKLFPQIAELYNQKRLSTQARIIGYGRSPYTSISFQKYLESVLEEKNHSIIPHVEYIQGNYDNTSTLYTYLEQHHTPSSPLLYYFALPAQITTQWATTICHTHSLGKNAFFLLEKPFGTSEENAQQMFEHLEACIGKKRIFLIDHYLGKSCVQSIVQLNNANPLLFYGLQPEHISSLDILLQESDDVEDRLGYYDGLGVIKDMVHSHVLQLIALSLIRCSLPLLPEKIQHLKHKILSHIDLYPLHTSSFGQYKNYSGKHKETATRIMTTLQCMLPQWKHVPIYVETGKKYASKYSAIRIKSTFSDTPSAYNSIIYELYPEELLHIELVNRYPENKNTSPVLISNTSKISCHGDDCLPEYARLILHALTEQYASFLSIEEVKDAWKITKKLESLQKNSPLLVY